MKHLVAALAWLGVVWGANGVMACSGSGGSRDGGASDAGDAAFSSKFEPCPQVTPTPGSACASYDPPLCEYGTSQDPQCDRLAGCSYLKSQGPTHGHWNVSDGGARPTDAGHPAACPATLAAVPRGKSCTDQTATCDYPTGTCGCRNQFRLSTSATPIWYCVDLGASCPTLRPRLGGACPSTHASALTCDYGGCFDDAHITEVCTPGAGWEEATPECTPPGG